MSRKSDDLPKTAREWARLAVARHGGITQFSRAVGLGKGLVSRHVNLTNNPKTALEPTHDLRLVYWRLAQVPIDLPWT